MGKVGFMEFSTESVKQGSGGNAMAPQPKMGYKTYFVILYFTYDESSYIKNSLRLFLYLQNPAPISSVFFFKAAFENKSEGVPFYRVHNEQTYYFC